MKGDVAFMPRLGVPPQALDSAVTERRKEMDKLREQKRSERSKGSGYAPALEGTVRSGGKLPVIKRSNISSSIRDLRKHLHGDTPPAETSVDPATSNDTSAEGLGQRLLLSLRCSQINESEKVIEQLSKMYADEQETALAVTEKNGNTHLHLLMRIRVDVENTEEYDIFQNKVVDLCDKLIIMGASLDDENLRGQTVSSFCRDYDMLDELKLRHRQRRKQRGNSLLGEAFNFKKAGNAVMAALAFKRGVKNRKKENPEEEKPLDGLLRKTHKTSGEPGSPTGRGVTMKDDGDIEKLELPVPSHDP
mmetsp:Transcript_22187/g.34778  ORF Transcript_22187/g.34778 Transcript_22187/m.34778 type:complete len:305 (+) Transcript_22187:496-1410(+)|eukprot:CAMPEP_0184324976 /NCGR_PEP_ID=MMETSP1049-20130417/137847_1 /TAXON_ID=77928 /ORGANISM="Proteomonas sulcata, Strain CCMP704" /LENGTH=304 /DNA_ID=CAMNT_0026646885 /DNA_START=364 /DNA_END=1278 /DNA_ORIENTATION=-